MKIQGLEKHPRIRLPLCINEEHVRCAFRRRRDSPDLLDFPRRPPVALSRPARCKAVERRDGETLNALLKRLDNAIGKAWSDDEFADEVNG